MVLITVLAIDRAIISGLERDLRRLATICTDDVVHLTGRTISISPSPSAATAIVTAVTGLPPTLPPGLPCRTTRRAALGLRKTTFLIECLFTGSKDKRTTAVGAVQCAILEI
jgi:hypothetical protein